MAQINMIWAISFFPVRRLRLDKQVAWINAKEIRNLLQRLQCQVPFASLDGAKVSAVHAHVVGEGFLAEVPLQAVAAQITPHDPLQLAFHKASYISVPLLVGLQTYK